MAAQIDVALTLANPLEDFLSQVRRWCIVDGKYPIELATQLDDTLTLANPLEDFLSQVRRWCM